MLDAIDSGSFRVFVYVVTGHSSSNERFLFCNWMVCGSTENDLIRGFGFRMFRNKPNRLCRFSNL